MYRYGEQLDALKGLLEYAEKRKRSKNPNRLKRPPDLTLNYGICRYLTTLFGYQSAKVDHEHPLRHFRTWSGRSESKRYPVPSDIKGMTPRARYFSGKLWDGKQLGYRISLMKHVIGKMEKQKGRHENE